MRLQPLQLALPVGSGTGNSHASGQPNKLSPPLFPSTPIGPLGKANHRPRPNRQPGEAASTSKLCCAGLLPSFVGRASTAGMALIFNLHFSCMALLALGDFLRGLRPNPSNRSVRPFAYTAISTHT